jgi:Acetyltransferases, including N-acetylases of ribosomal proteins
MPELMGSVLFGADEFVADFVRVRLGGHTRFVDGYTALGVVRRGIFAGGVVYHNFQQLAHGNTIETSIAFDDATWALPQTLRTLFTYPFLNLECVRLTSIVAEGNERSRKFCEGLGFDLEGIHPRGMDGKEAAVSYGLLRENCRWIRNRDIGQKFTTTANAA